MAGTARSRKVESRLIVAAPKVSVALTEVRDILDAPFGKFSVAGPEQYGLKACRDHLLRAAQELKSALEAVHEVNAR